MRTKTQSEERHRQKKDIVRRKTESEERRKTQSEQRNNQKKDIVRRKTQSSKKDTVF